MDADYFWETGRPGGPAVSSLVGSCCEHDYFLVVSVRNCRFNAWNSLFEAERHGYYIDISFINSIFDSL